MPKTRSRNNNASPPPEVLKVLGELSDDVWAAVMAVMADFSDDLEEIGTARMRLATIILDLAKNGQLEITQKTSRLMCRQMLTRKGRTRLAADGRGKHGGPRRKPGTRANVSLD